MGDCTYCGKSAGFLKKEHKECKQKSVERNDRMATLVSSTVLQGKPFDTLEQELGIIAKDHYIDPTQTRDFLTKYCFNCLSKVC